MKAFNLAETRIVERSFCKEQMNRHLRIIAVLAVITFFVGAVSQACRQSIRNRATHVKSELAKVQEKCVAIKREGAHVDISLGQRGWQKQLARDSKRQLGMLESVVHCVPGDVWLRKVVSSDKTGGLSIDGEASTFEALNGYITRLRNEAGFKDVRLTGTTISGQNNKFFVEFSLELQSKLSLAQKPADSNKVPNLAENH
jgi:Tfp pilus assembly protein PilN